MSDTERAIRFLIIRDYKENKHKCTLSPLRGRDRFEFLQLKRPGAAPEIEPIGGGVLLTIDAPVLTRRDLDSLEQGAITIIDSTWARVPKVLARLRIAPGEGPISRSLPRDIVSAYPRTSKLYKDPQRGLASVEAVFASLVVLGVTDLTVLKNYRWARQFIEQNDLTWRRLGWDPHFRLGLSSLSV